MNVLEYIEELDDDNLEINISSDEQFQIQFDKPVLIMSHDLSLTGAPAQLLFLAKALRELGYYPFLFADKGGGFLEEFLSNEIIVINANSNGCSTAWLDKVIKLFNVVFVNTLLLEPYVSYMAPRIPHIFWWIHENSYHYNASLCTELTEVPSLTILSASLKTKDLIKKYINKNNRLLNVCVEDKGYVSAKEHANTRFLWAGSLDSNKSVDILLNAIITMPAQLRNKAEFYIVGRTSDSNDYSELVEKVASKISNIHFLDKLKHDDLLRMIDDVDSVVVSSLEETTSMIAVEGLMKQKVVICSDGCGVAGYMEDGKNGFVFPSGNYEKLSEKMISVIEKQYDLDSISKIGRELYTLNYNYDSFVSALKEILDETLLINDNMNACSGCGACSLACPQNAIKMIERKGGFVYPEIDRSKCINCGLCRRGCPVNGSHKNMESNHLKVYAYRTGSDEKRSESQSGGAFTALAENIVSNGGIVFGASLDNNFAVKYVEADNIEDLKKLKGSKYVQAYTEDIFAKVKEKLLLGKSVLFCGTSCHVDGLLGYLKGENTDNLITCDFICHGVPAPDLFRKYIGYRQENGEISKFNFRDKSIDGWREHAESWEQNGQKVVSKEYSDMFYSHCSFRECCYQCNYASYEKPADITIGDFWGIENVLKEIDDNKGVSVIMSRTDKGSRLVSAITSSGYLKEVNKESCIQNNLSKPTKRPFSTDLFWDGFYEKSFRSFFSLFIWSEYFRYNKTLMDSFNRNDTLVKIIDMYCRQHGLEIGAVCGNWKLVDTYIEKLHDSNKKIPTVLNVFNRDISFINFDTVSLDEYSCDNSRSGVILVLDMENTLAYIEAFKKKGIEINRLLPASFIIDDEV